jgi:Ca2+-transporting ATPase
MRDPPRRIGTRLLGRPQLAAIGVVGLVSGVAVLGAAHVARRYTDAPEQTRSVLLLALLAVHLSLPYVVRARRFTFERGWRRARGLLWCIAGSAALQVLMMVVPLGRRALSLTAVPAWAWPLALGAAASAIGALDLIRHLGRGRGAEG